MNFDEFDPIIWICNWFDQIVWNFDWSDHMILDEIEFAPTEEYCDEIVIDPIVWNYDWSDYGIMMKIDSIMAKKKKKNWSDYGIMMKIDPIIWNFDGIKTDPSMVGILWDLIQSWS